MQVVHFAKALLAFLPAIRTFSLQKPRRRPRIRGRPPRSAPLLLQRYEIFRRKARNVKSGRAMILIAIIAIVAVIAMIAIWSGPALRKTGAVRWGTAPALWSLRPCGPPMDQKFTVPRLRSTRMPSLALSVNLPALRALNLMTKSSWSPSSSRKLLPRFTKVG